ncbi:uncharacterized protein [Haliotis asinina]|uniref:uncharacterized protein n=1 Tax=Haliotis asinina TaxID=109174 RepID=UPI003531A8D3
MKSALSLLVALAVVAPAHLMALNQAMTGGNPVNNYQGHMMNQQGIVPTATGNSHVTVGPSAMSMYQLAMGSDKAAKMAMVKMMMNSPNAENLIPLMVLSNTNGGANNNKELLRTMAIMNTLNQNQQGGNGQGMESLLMAMALSANQEGKPMFPMLSGSQNNGGSSSSSGSAEGGNSQLMDMFMLSRML